MSLQFERYIAGRYLRKAQGREEGRRFVRFITYVAIGGVAVGVAALLLALSIVRGFSEEIQEKIIGFGAHVQVESFQDTPLGEASYIADSLRVWPGVASVAPVVQEFTLMRRSATDIDGVILWGIEWPPGFIRDNIIRGSFDVALRENGPQRVVLGADLARLLGVDVGDVVTAFSLRRGPTGSPGFASPRLQQFEVAGIYQTFLQNFDELYVLLDIGVARTFLEYSEDEVSRLDVTLQDAERAMDIVHRVEESFGFPVMARTIFEVYRGLFAWVDLQENIIPIVISVIIIVAAFNIIATLMMMILEKTREIGVLGSLGASHRVIRRIFLMLGLMIGVLGTAIGSVVALITALIQERWGVIPLPAEAYYLDRAPVALDALDFVLVGGIALLLCIVAAYIPARVASRIDPVRAIRLQ